VERYLRRIKLKEQTAPVWAHGVGAFVTGNILLIGEQASDPTNAPEQQPFCSSKGCSGWLNRLLEQEEIPEERLFWLNALNNDGSRVQLQRYVAELRPSHVVALGSVASKLCQEQNVLHHRFYHPQYWKRFHSKKPYALIEFLRRNLHPSATGIESISGINRNADYRVVAVS
jgi:hypothetical protein